MRFILILLAVVLTITSCHAQLRLNHIQLKGTHNSYHVSTPPSLPEWDASLPSLATQASTLNVRAFELDVNTDEGKFNVRHFMTYDQGTNCANLTSCLTIINDWAQAQTDAPIIFIQIEAKSFISTPAWNDIDGIITKIITRARLITPTDVRGSYPTLRDAVLSGQGWPTLESARGKFIIFLDDDYSDYRVAPNVDLTNRIAFPALADTTNPLAAFIKFNDPVTDGTKIRSAVASNFIVRTRADSDIVNLPIPVTYDDAVNRLFKRMDLNNNSLVDFDELYEFLEELQPSVAGIKNGIQQAFDMCKGSIGSLNIDGYKCVENAAIAVQQGSITLKADFDANGDYTGKTILSTTQTSTAAIASGAHIISTDYPGGAYTLRGLGSASNLTYAFTLPYPYICNPVSTINVTCTNNAVNGIPESSTSSSSSSSSSTGGSNPTDPTPSTGTSTGKNNAMIHVVSIWNIVIIMIVAFILM